MHRVNGAPLRAGPVPCAGGPRQPQEPPPAHLRARSRSRSGGGSAIVGGISDRELSRSGGGSAIVGGITDRELSRITIEGMGDLIDELEAEKSRLMACLERSEAENSRLRACLERLATFAMDTRYP